MPWLVYETMNTINGKIYIGVCNSQRRGVERYLGSGTALAAAIRKHGRENFRRTILIEVETAREAYLIEAAVVNDAWKARRDTYNLKTGGLGGSGFEMSEAAKEAIRRARLGVARPPETRERISRSLKGRRHSAERRLAISAAMRAANVGRKLSEETKRKISESQRKAWARGRKTRKDGS